MANGFLSGQYDAHTQFEGKEDFRSRMPQYTEEGYAKAKGLLDLLRSLAEEKQATSAQINGTLAHITALFGFMLAGLVIKEVLSDQ